MTGTPRPCILSISRSAVSPRSLTSITATSAIRAAASCSASETVATGPTTSTPTRSSRPFSALARCNASSTTRTRTPPSSEDETLATAWLSDEGTRALRCYWVVVDCNHGPRQPEVEAPPLQPATATLQQHNNNCQVGLSSMASYAS